MKILNGSAYKGIDIGSSLYKHYIKQCGACTCIDYFVMSTGAIRPETTMRVFKHGGNDGNDIWGHRIIGLCTPVIFNCNEMTSPATNIPIKSNLTRTMRLNINEEHTRNQKAVENLVKKIGNSGSVKKLNLHS